MTTVPPQSQLVRFDEIYPETKAIAVLRQEPPELKKQGFQFHEAYDDLDYLVFLETTLQSGHRVALIRRKHSPNPGTEICVVPNETAVVAILLEVIQFLNLSTADLSWIHPQYEENSRIEMARKWLETAKEMS